jgi:hypothetical protein
MTKEKKKKVLLKFFFPKENKTIEAETQEEALNILSSNK